MLQRLSISVINRPVFSCQGRRSWGIPGAVFLLSREYLRQFNETSVQDRNLQYIIGGAEAGRSIVSVLQNKGLDALSSWIYDPILTHTGPLVQVIFYQPVMALGGGGQNLDDKVRSALAAHIVQLVGITHNGQVGFHQGINVLGPVAGLLKEPDGERAA